MITNLEKLTDMEIITLCINEDVNYYEQMIIRYKNLVFSVVRKMINDNEDVEDLVQEIFIKSYKNLDKYSSEFKFSTWIMRISTNHVIDFKRKKKLSQISYDEAQYLLTNSETPEDNFIVKEDKKKLNEVVDSLPVIYKEPIILYHERGLSYQEISNEINEPLSKVKNRIFRGRKMLKEKILIDELG